jgi:hypothetical protein
MKKAVIVAPYWRDPQHVGCYRVKRFIGWFHQSGTEVVVVRAGRKEGVESTEWGREVTVADPFGFYGDVAAGGTFEMKPRRPNRLRRMLGYWIFNPDPTVVWAKRAAAHPLVRAEAAGAGMVLSSSPPESVHVGAALLARRLGAEFCMDMRDGWLDEPLRPVLRDFRIRQWQEARLERRLLEQAKAVFVSSDVWRELLTARVPRVRGRVQVLTNAYPEGDLPSPSRQGRQDGDLVLLHAGRFSASRSSQRPEILLTPLLDALQGSDSGGRIVLLGYLESADVDAIGRLSARLEGTRWTIETRAHLPRAEMLEMVVNADGLLLLSMSDAAVPSKLYEYIPARRPLLAVTPRNSATARICSRLAQATVIETGFDRSSAAARVNTFLARCSADTVAADEPAQFSEPALAEVFLGALGVASGAGANV